ncbi:diguanylate cyclase (GGDEF) domain-containing protein [Frankineae bacterium MT45]|nr:diguanylate cyclase (GGDEF) domain-containing protein [Frankineae bacterium MT45]
MALSSPLRRLTADGGSLRVWLLSLLIVPIVGVLVATSLQIRTQAQLVGDAKATQRLIRSAAELHDVREALGAEIAPAIGATALEDRKTSATLGLKPDQALKLMSQYELVPALRVKTNAAVATLASNPDYAVRAESARNEIAGIRLKIDTDAGSQAKFQAAVVFQQAVDFMTDLGKVENDLLGRAGRSGLGAATNQAITDLRIVTEAVQFMSSEIAFFTSAEHPGVFASPDLAPRYWARVWGGTQSYSDDALNATSATMSAMWRQAMQNPKVAFVNSELDKWAVNPQKMPISESVNMVLMTNDRDAVLQALPIVAMARVHDAARSEQSNAQLALAGLAVLILVVALLSLLAALLAVRSFGRPLDRLADQAGRISDGELVEVTASGPREVRTVARGLSASVDSLRQVEAKAAALIGDDALSRDELVASLRDAAPGPLAVTMNASLNRIIDEMRSREEAQEALTHRATHDALTELPNRAEAIHLTDLALRSAAETDTSTALMFVDLDHFKIVNDSFGHAAGDLVLRTVAARMRAAIREGDIAARLGGDEFVVLCENIADSDECVLIANRLVECVTDPIDIGIDEVVIGASVGVAITRGHSTDADQLMREADAAAYRAKKSGRGQISIFDETLRMEIEERSALERAISDGLRDGEFVLHYQPIVDLQTSTMTGVEALIRWNRPGFGFMQPDSFIPVAEASSLINDIGRWVLTEATEQLARWRRLSPPDDALTMAINLSARHLSDRAMPGEVRAALEASGIPAELLTVEVTETSLIDSGVAQSNLRALRELGVKVAIDDFGTGYTSIGQLPTLPADILKIDRSFVAAQSEGSAELVRLMVATAHSFHLSVVAEGIEFEQQAEQMRGAQIETGQGFFFAYPTSAEEITQRLRERATANHAAH